MYRQGSSRRFKVSEKDLELLITIDDPGEETLGEDTFHDHSTEKIHTSRPNEQRTAVTVDRESDG